jgi:hypothetical protein
MHLWRRGDNYYLSDDLHGQQETPDHTSDGALRILTNVHVLLTTSDEDAVPVVTVYSERWDRCMLIAVSFEGLRTLVTLLGMRANFRHTLENVDRDAEDSQ